MKTLKMIVFFVLVCTFFYSIFPLRLPLVGDPALIPIGSMLQEPERYHNQVIVLQTGEVSASFYFFFAGAFRLEDTESGKGIWAVSTVRPSHRKASIAGKLITIVQLGELDLMLLIRAAEISPHQREAILSYALPSPSLYFTSSSNLHRYS